MSSSRSKKKKLGIIKKPADHRGATRCASHRSPQTTEHDVNRDARKPTERGRPGRRKRQLRGEQAPDNPGGTILVACWPKEDPMAGDKKRKGGGLQPVSLRFTSRKSRVNVCLRGGRWPTGRSGSCRGRRSCASKEMPAVKHAVSTLLVVVPWSRGLIEGERLQIPTGSFLPRDDWAWVRRGGINERGHSIKENQARGHLLVCCDIHIRRLEPQQVGKMAARTNGHAQPFV